MNDAPSPEAAVFLRRLSSVMDVASSVPSGSCSAGAAVVDAAGEGASWVEPVLCGTAPGGRFVE